MTDSAGGLTPAAPGAGGGGRVALITMDPGKIGAMSCNPAIGGLAKGQMVREIDALGGLMGLAADATGIQFRVLNQSKGPAVQGPRSQNDKYSYAAEVQRLLGTRPNLDVLAGTVEDFVVEGGRCRGGAVPPGGDQRAERAKRRVLRRVWVHRPLRRGAAADRRRGRAHHRHVHAGAHALGPAEDARGAYRRGLGRGDQRGAAAAGV